MYMYVCVSYVLWLGNHRNIAVQLYELSHFFPLVSKGGTLCVRERGRGRRRGGEGMNTHPDKERQERDIKMHVCVNYSQTSELPLFLSQFDFSHLAK